MARSAFAAQLAEILLAGGSGLPDRRRHPRRGRRIRGHVLRTPLATPPGCRRSPAATSASSSKPSSRPSPTKSAARSTPCSGCSSEQARHRRALVTASAGNHGRALARAARACGLPLTSTLPARRPADQDRAMRAEGAELRLCRDYDEAERRREGARRRPARRSSSHRTRIPTSSPAPARSVSRSSRTAGGATPSWPPVGGGGLISGIADRARARRPDSVVGVEAEASSPFTAGLAAGRIVEIDVQPTLADGLAGNLDPDTPTFDIVRTRRRSTRASCVVGSSARRLSDRRHRRACCALDGAAVTSPKAAGAGRAVAERCLARQRDRHVRRSVTSRVDPARGGQHRSSDMLNARFAILQRITTRGLAARDGTRGRYPSHHQATGSRTAAVERQPARPCAALLLDSARRASRRRSRSSAREAQRARSDAALDFLGSRAPDMRIRSAERRRQRAAPATAALVTLMTRRRTRAGARTDAGRSASRRARTPSENRSLRGSTGPPSACSGRHVADHRDGVRRRASLAPTRRACADLAAAGPRATCRNREPWRCPSGSRRWCRAGGRRAGCRASAPRPARRRSAPQAPPRAAD